MGGLAGFCIIQEENGIFLLAEECVEFFLATDGY